MNGRLGAPFGRQPPNSLVHILVEAKQVADQTVVEQGTVGVSVRDVHIDVGVGSPCGEPRYSVCGGRREFVLHVRCDELGFLRQRDFTMCVVI